MDCLEGVIGWREEGIVERKGFILVFFLGF